MQRREFLRSAGAAGLASVGLLAGCGPRAPGGAAPKALPQIGYLVGEAPPAPGEADPFMQGLRDLGYVEGQNVIVHRRYAVGSQDRPTDLASELVALGVDVLVARQSGSAVPLKRATGTTPIVFLGGSDPVGLGLVQSLAHPGGNATGLTSASDQTIAKHLDFLRQLLPGVSEVAVLSSLDLVTDAVQIKSIEATGQALGITVQTIKIDRTEEVETAFQTAVNAKLGAFIIPTGPLLSRAELAELAVKYRLPTVGNSPTKRTVIGYGANANDLRRRGAGYVDRILKGTKPADLPVAQPTTFDLYINVKLAREIGIAVPQALLAQATEVIE